jgi:hypothetical protein
MHHRRLLNIVLFLVVSSISSITVRSLAQAPRPLEDGQQEITVASLPGSVCNLQSAAKPAEVAFVIADDEGIVHVWASRSLTSDRYTLTCDEDKISATHDFDLNDSAAFVPAKPRVPSTTRTTLMPLQNPMALEPAQVIKAGYPPRPDPASPLYKKWLDIVSKPLIHIDPTLVARPDVHFNPETGTTSTVWDGMTVHNSVRYSLAVGTFWIPIFSSTVSGSKAAIWSGLDGFNTNDVVQDGVFVQFSGSVGSYSAWYEYFPDPPVFSSMVVAPTDSVDFWAWEGDANCNYGTNLTGRACFWYENKTRGTAVGTFNVAKPASAPAFVGSTSEGVMERVNGAPLASWPAGGAFLYLDAYEWSWAYHDISSDADWNTTLKNASNQTMATAGNFNGVNEMSFTWSRAQ